MKKLLILITIMLVGVGCATLNPEEAFQVRDRVIGEYGYKSKNGEMYKDVFLDNGTVTQYIDDKKIKEYKWKLLDKVLYIMGVDFVAVFRINTDRSITQIANIEGGEIEVLTKEKQVTWKKIK